MSFTLLMTCVGGELAPFLIRLLKESPRHDIKVIGVDARADAGGRHFADAFAIVPLGTDARYVDAIGDLVTAHKVDLVLPTSDEEALALSRTRERIEALGCTVACADHAALAIFSDKVLAYRRMAELGLPAPDWRAAETLDELAEAVDELYRAHGELVVKPAVARGGRGVTVIRSDITGTQTIEGGREIHADHDSFLREHLAGYAGQLPALAMQRLVEPVHDLDMLAWKGRPVRVVPRRRVDSARPNEGHTIVGNPDLIDLGRRIIEGFDLSWLYDCDIMYDRDGRPGVLEVNPRQSGSVSATIAAGVPLLDDLVSLAKGEAVPEIDIPVGRVVVPFKGIGVSHAGAHG